MEAITKEQLAQYAFLALTPSYKVEEEGTHYHILDCADLESFENKWNEQPLSLHAEFGYDLPVVVDDGCVPVERFTEDPSEYFVKRVVDITFTEYVELVKQVRDEEK